MTDAEKAAEFSRRRNIPGVEVSHSKYGAHFDVRLTLCGKEIAYKTTRTSGRRHYVTYFLPTS